MVRVSIHSQASARRLFLRCCLTLFVVLLAPALSHAQEKPFVVPSVESWKPAKGELVWTSLQSISYADPSLEDEARYLAGFLGNLPVLPGKGGSVSLLLEGNRKLGNEGYQLTISPRGIAIRACTEQGVLWGIQTLQQLHVQGHPLPCGTITDRPRYGMRGMMLDVGRKYIPLSYLYSLVELLSYYKMNTLQVHLNDNGMRAHFHDDWNETYAGFRLESDFFPGLTSQDGFYTKQAFHDFILFARSRGVEIIPEFDTPAHSLCFTHYRPSLGSDEFGADHLNLRNPCVIPFVDSLYAEYLGGLDPVFCCPRVHIGTDEYSNRDSTVVELFRSYTDHLIRHVESFGKQPVLWGSLTHCKGKTPVKSDGVMMEMWYNGYADPHEMRQQGYEMICVPGHYAYIVPEAGYYYNYLNLKYLYERWTPAQINEELFADDDPHIHGGLFCVWNDVVKNGISVGDIHHRVFPAVQAISEKTWRAVNDTLGFALWDARRQALGEGYRCNQLGRTEVSLPVLTPSATIDASDQAQLGYDYQVDFDIRWADEATGTLLTEGPYARVWLADPIGGWLGFSRDGYLYTFSHKGKPGITEHISIRGTNRSTVLYVNGRLVQELGIEKVMYAEKKTYNYVRTLVFPLQRTGAFRSHITNFLAVHTSNK